MRTADNQLTTLRSFSAHIAGSSDPQGERVLSFSSYLEVVRHSPRRRRTTVARALFPYLFRRTVRSTVESCEFDSLKNYKTSYGQLAQLLGRDQECSPSGETEFLVSIENRGAHPGTIALREYLFLSAFASILAPERAVEIGTLAGFLGCGHCRCTSSAVSQSKRRFGGNHRQEYSQRCRY
jgi:hypothetical protein